MFTCTQSWADSYLSLSLWHLPVQMQPRPYGPRIHFTGCLSFLAVGPKPRLYNLEHPQSMFTLSESQPPNRQSRRLLVSVIQCQRLGGQGWTAVKQCREETKGQWKAMRLYQVLLCAARKTCPAVWLFLYLGGPPIGALILETLV